ncbi:MAG: helix-turn-helix domain-containing protein [Mediterraneibacter faecis]
MKSLESHPKISASTEIQKAARLLATTQLPVSIISNSLGFEDQLAFSRTFKKFYNVSPTDYRSHLKP